MIKRKKAENSNDELINMLHNLEDEFGENWYLHDDYLGSDLDNDRRQWLKEHSGGDDTKTGRKRYRYFVTYPNGKKRVYYGAKELCQAIGYSCDYDGAFDYFTNNNCYFYREKVDPYAIDYPRCKSAITRD